MIDKIYIFWLVLVISWNVGYPEASPWLDVLIAVILSAIVYYLRRKK